MTIAEDLNNLHQAVGRLTTLVQFYGEGKIVIGGIQVDLAAQKSAMKTAAKAICDNIKTAVDSIKAAL